MIGTQLAHYEIVSAIGKGGMGEVWRARDTKLGREVAIKTLPEEFAKDADRLARFEREAKLLASLNHPNIAAIYGLEEHEGTRFLVLELVEGPTLEDRIKQGAIPVEESLKLALQIAEALEAAHENGVIHRDLKPANIKVTPDGKVKVLDFGLAKAFEGDQDDVSVSNSPTLSMAATQQGIILGTAAYMSPEQASGMPTDKRADIWSFGVVLFEMLTGRQVFTGESVSHILAAVLRAEPEWNGLPNIHPRLRLLLERCLEKKATDREHDIADARVDIQKVLADPSGVSVEPVAEVGHAAPYSRVPWVAAIALGVVVAGVTSWLVKPIEPGTVSRSEYFLPDGRNFASTDRPILAVSPDGTRFAYITSGGLYLRQVDQFESRVIPGTARPLANPVFSPDGEWLAFWSASDGQLMKIPTVGGTAVSLTEVPDRPIGISWDVDDTILYQTPEGIVRVSADGGEPELLLPDFAEANIGYPQLLPGGNAVLFDTASGQVGVQALDSEEPKMLLPGVHPRYVPTGHIVYAQAGALFAVPFDLGSLEVTGGPVPLVQGVADQYALSDSGTLVYLPGDASTSNTRALAFVDRNGLVEPLDVPPKEYLSPRLSPDGQRLAVESIEADGSVIWIYDRSGNTAIRQLTFDGDNQRPIWTPDSSQITFASDRDGTMSLYTMRADGSGVAERLTTAEEGTSHWPGSWAPDGETLVFNVERDPTDWDISTLSVGSGETQDLYEAMPGGTTYTGGAALSPDGRWLAYSAGVSTVAFDVYVEPFPLTGARQRVSQAEGGVWPLWSPDGRELFFRMRSVGGGVTLKGVDIATEPNFGFSNEQTLPVEDFIVVTRHRDYDITPDGQRFLMVFPADQAGSSEPTRPQINIVLNWFGELKERVPVP